MKRSASGFFLVSLLTLPAFAQPPQNLTATIDQQSGAVELEWNAPLEMAFPSGTPELQNIAVSTDQSTAARSERRHGQRMQRLLARQPMRSNWQPSAGNTTSELDEFIEFRIYRNGVMIGTTPDPGYTDVLSLYGEYSYSVTAYYTEGESTPAGPVTVVWYDPSTWVLRADFDAGMPEGWTIQATVASSTWHVDMTGERALFDTPYMLVDSDIVGPGPHLQERLISPEINIGGANTIVLAYEYYFLEYIQEILDVDWSANGGATWNTIVTISDNSFSTLPMTHDLSEEMTPYSSVWLSWYYDDNNNWGYYAGLDNVSLNADIPDNAIIFDMIGQQNVIPPEGGTLVYDVHFAGQIPNPFVGARFWTSIEFPNGQTFSPLVMFQFNVPQIFDYWAPGLTQAVPELAPGGGYWLTGYVGSWTNPNQRRTDRIYFFKQGPAADSNYEFDPADWVAGGEWPMITGSGEQLAQLPTEFAVGHAYPNPFNPSTTIALSLPDAAELTVKVFNVNGQVVATLAHDRFPAGTHRLEFDASTLASGLYFIRTSVPGHLENVQKAMLVR